MQSYYTLIALDLARERSEEADRRRLLATDEWNSASGSLDPTDCGRCDRGREPSVRSDRPPARRERADPEPLIEAPQRLRN